MNHKSITPNPQQPVDRVPTGQLPSALAELSEAALAGDADGLLPHGFWLNEAQTVWGAKERGWCAFDGDEE